LCHGIEPNETKGLGHDRYRIRACLHYRSGPFDPGGSAARRRLRRDPRAEKQSGTSTQARAELRTVLDFISKGDVLLVTRVDRLARSIGDLQDIVRTLKAKGASLRATEQPIDTSTAAGKCFLDMLGVFAEFETNLRRERQLEGIAKAKVAGVYKGRKPSIDQAQVEKLKAEGLGASQIAKRLNIGLASVYRVLAAAN
jgi:DNA invertase Pin-like site-specific DNA recombinase